MKFGNEPKKQFTTNHRANYTNYNKSTIFDPSKSTTLNDNKRTLMRTKTQSSFTPNLKEETPFNRRIKEFYSNPQYVKDFGTNRSTRGYLTREHSTNKKSDLGKSVNLTAKDRRFLELNPNHKLEESKSLTRSASFFEKRSFKNDGVFENARDRRWNDMNSNIFNDPVKIKIIIFS
jgi:hypothetical protein